MSTPAPHSHHSDDATADDSPPTDGITDEVRSDSAAHTGSAPQTGGPDDRGDGDVDPADLNMPGRGGTEGTEQELDADNAVEADTLATLDPEAPPA